MRPLTGFSRLTLEVMCKKHSLFEEYIPGSLTTLFPCKNLIKLALPILTHTSQYLF